MKWRERSPLPKDIYMKLASLHRQFNELQRAYEDEVHQAQETIARKYLPGMGQLEKELQDIRRYVTEMNFAADHIRWQMNDVFPHETPVETTTKIKRAQARERRKRGPHGKTH